jgi:hypothetical protein
MQRGDGERGGPVWGRRVLGGRVANSPFNLLTGDRAVGKDASSAVAVCIASASLQSGPILPICHISGLVHVVASCGLPVVSEI